MNPLAEKFELRANQFALVFETDQGIEADDLGTFLKRAATLARRVDAELRVIRFEHGSLAAIFDAVKKSKIGEGAAKEFVKAPIASTGAITGVVAAVASAFIWAFDTDNAGATPIARTGACVIEEKNVSEIKLVTNLEVVVLMDPAKARRVRELERDRQAPKAERHQLQALTERASSGLLEGGVVSIYGELHFRPDGFKFLVPVDVSRLSLDVDIYPDAHFRVTGELVTINGRPDSIIIQDAKRV